MSLRSAPTLYQKRGLTLVTGPTVEPVSVRDMRTHLRLDDADTSEDSYIFQLIAEARETVERQINVALVSQSWKLTVDHWPGKREPWWDGVRDGSINMLHTGYAWLVLPVFPLLSVDGVNVYNEAGTATAVTVSSVFDIDKAQEPGRMALKSGQTWPVALRPTNAIEVTFTAGYGTAASDVPASFKTAIRQLVAYIYTHRGDCDTASAMSASGAESIVGRYKVARL